MRTILVAAFLVGCTSSNEVAEREQPTCDVVVSSLDGISVTVDVTASCIGDGWTVEYRLLSSGLVNSNRRDHACGSATHVEFLNMPGLSDLHVFGWIRDADRRVECRVTHGGSTETVTL